VNEKEIRGFIADHKAGKYVSYREGALADSKIYEVLVLHDDEVKTRFVIEPPQDAPQYCSEFSALCRSIDPQSLTGMQSVSRIQMQKFSSYVAAFVFLMAVSTAIFIIVTQNDIKFAVVPFFLGLIASGGALFFGKWIMPSEGVLPQLERR
jgi:hypothetical protein